MSGTGRRRSFWKQYPSYRVQPLLYKRYNELPGFHEWLENRRIRKEGEEYVDAEERREFGFRVRPNFGQVLGYIQKRSP